MRFPSLRLPAIVPAVLSRPRFRRFLRIGGGLLLAAYFALGLLVLGMRYLILPGIENYRGDIERQLSRTLARPVAIQAIDAHWQGLWPRLEMHGLDIRDDQGRTALYLANVDADLGWSSLWHFEPRFARIEIASPDLDIRREADGRWFVAGLPIDPEQRGDSGFAAWLFVQGRIVIRDASVVWHDARRGAPSLVLQKLNFDLQNSGGRHRFALTAEPPPALATPLDLRGELRGKAAQPLASWSGQIYLALDHADLAAWRTWVDYPLELVRGNGGLRAWLTVANAGIESATVDLHLADTALRLAADLPLLELESVSGRLAGRWRADGFSLSSRQLALAAGPAIRLAPTDLDLRWQAPGANTPMQGEIAANVLDLGALADLADYLPLEPTVRRRLSAYAPQGRVEDLKLSWSGEIGALRKYGFKARFQDLGIRAQGAVPGFSGLDGRIDGNEKGGWLELASRGAAIDLPAVFAESRLALDELSTRSEWTMVDGQVDARIERASFHNTDAAGEASGRYRGGASAPGEIDLSARLTRADGGAVWRYMPLVVNAHVRDWLQRSIVGGTATATLRLKGDLKYFPFDDGSGIFEIKGPFQNATLDYAPGWPKFENVTGDLSFVGSRMVIRAQRAGLWEVKLAEIKAEIANLGAHEPELAISGIARGPTADFLRFIAASPIAERIDRFTDTLHANGHGELRLNLDLPLHRVADTRVDGRYRFIDNGLIYDPDLPPLTDINGELRFTGNQLQAQKIRARMLGTPLTVDLATAADGVVDVRAAGTLTVDALRRQYGHPLFEHLAGAAPWNGTIRIRKRAAEVRIESSLHGVASSLPEPFNKTTNAALPFVFERKPSPEPAREPQQLLTVSLGEALRVHWLRGQGGERGLIAVGRKDLRLPERGVLLGAQLAKLDLAFWRRLTEAPLGAGGTGAAAAPAVNQIDLRAEQALAQGHRLTGFQLSGRRDAGVWRLALKSREAAGNLEWNGEGAGHVSGRFGFLALPDDPASTGNGPEHGDDEDKPLPAIDLVVDRLLWRERELGGLKLNAANAGGVWRMGFRWHNDDGAGEGELHWRTGGQQTSLTFQLSANNIERLLIRIGYPGVVRRGSATLQGTLAWAGSPVDWDYASLEGKLGLTAADGQFNKLEPGVGRLLGIVSLQSLPRRIGLDFRDIFSEGFAFDRITGQMNIRGGILNTRDLDIRGPAAHILMNGSVDLVHETQDLKVRVQPALSETVATGVILAHPAVGAAAWVMNRIFGNPLDKAFAFDYAVTGAWADPKVEKVSVQAPGQAPAEGEAR